ncbi:ATP-dependent nuclease [Paenibacillus sp. HJGM_3]|uniref:ATP-dependent nuclease n=1 Tax=Paenibacillus sp. HJGM_3 TaxID=3379816 RepID=UPI00385D888A
MPPKKKTQEITEDLFPWFEASRPNLRRMIIKNFRCIGSTPVTIDLDEIVVLVGPNNAGKSSILKAYEVVMNHGSKKAQLSEADFPNGIVDPNMLPEIELHTNVNGDTSPAVRWVQKDLENEKAIVRERWIWNSPNTDPKRQGFDVEKNDWDNQVPWGAPNIAKENRPEPHMVEAFAHPIDQEKQIVDLLTAIVKDRVKTIQKTTSDDGEETEYAKLLTQLSVIRRKILDESKTEIESIETELTSSISGIFPGYIVKFDSKAEDNIENDVSLFKNSAKLLMGPEFGYQSAIDKQGSGARRTLLWSALRLIAQAENAKKAKSSRPHVLLLDEPELCLHPNAVREACKVLYDLPTKGDWQVMVTTHSPAFIDVSRDNTTIVRVERSNDGEISGTTVFRPEKVKLDENDREQLKLLNMFDPHVAEFFFGGHSIIVEGDTEYTAFKYITSKKPDLYRNVHIIRARGKATIVSLCKILNHFGSGYSVLHDSDFPYTKDGKKKNSAWTQNNAILKKVKEAIDPSKVRIVASLPNFEAAYFSQTIRSGKPYNALTQLKKNNELFKIVEELLISLLDFTKDTPQGSICWNEEDQLTPLVAAMAESAVYYSEDNEEEVV